MLWNAAKSYSNRKRTQGKTKYEKEKEINEPNNNKYRILKARKKNNENIIILIILFLVALVISTIIELLFTD